MFDYNKYHSAGRRQKKKSRRTADTFPCAYEAAALRKIRAAVSCDVKPLARRVVQKKAIAEDEEIKTPFAIIKKRSANCI